MKLKRVLGWIAVAIPLVAILSLAVGYWPVSYTHLTLPTSDLV